MLCEGRIDALGALYHIIAHGIEHRKLVAGDTDHKAFVERPGRLLHDLQESQDAARRVTPL